jgi:FtsP/CotA-like multicopper oxidase with cupredoxin domain
MQSLRSLVSGLLFAGLAIAAPYVPSEIEPRASNCNTATNRACWIQGKYDINTDYEKATPPGSIVAYNWEITEIANWTGPDGVVKPFVQLVNGQFPGPTLHANWGDTILVTITNKMKVNG